jgi:hypothetical protein
MAKSTDEQIFIGDGDMVVELLGEAKAEFIADRNARAQERALLEAKEAERKEARESAIKKLAEIAGLTKEELASIL